jgi:hypothetical protein
LGRGFFVARVTQIETGKEGRHASHTSTLAGEVQPRELAQQLMIST